MDKHQADSPEHLIHNRFGSKPRLDGDMNRSNALRSMLGRGSCRAFLDKPVTPETLTLLCAAAFASPTKSDLQQRDIIVVKSRRVRRQLVHLLAGQSWVESAPELLVFCGNNKRLRDMFDWQGEMFANDHLDAFFNAATDAAIALGAFVTAAEAIGLACCPLSAVRNQADAVSKVLKLPEHVFPFAGLALGYPKDAPQISKRLPLSVTCHTDCYDETGAKAAIEEYSDRRAKEQPYKKQRFPDRFGQQDGYGWIEDKVRQYSQPERASFGAYIRSQGFQLD